MSGGFFRGTSADQDTRFSNKQAKLLKSQKFPPELEHLVDTSKVKMDVMRPWIANRVTEFIGFEDEVLINFIYGLLEGKQVNGKEVQISITGFMERNTGKFMKELWALLLSAQNNASGVPQQFLDAKEEETKKKKAELDRIAENIQRKKEKESQDLEQERNKKMDAVNDIIKGVDAGREPSSRHLIDAGREPSSRHLTTASRGRLAEEEEPMDRNGSGGRSRAFRSPYSADRFSSPRRMRSRSVSKSPPYSRSYSKQRHRSRSLSASPKRRGRSSSSEMVRRGSPTRSLTPRRRHSPTPPRRRSSYSRRHMSPSPTRYIMRSPRRRRSRSPLGRRSRSPVRRWSRSPIRRSVPRDRSRSPVRHSPSSIRWRSPYLSRRRSRSPIRDRSRSPARRRYRVSPLSPQLRSSPVRRRSPIRSRRRSPSPSKHRSPSPARPSAPLPIRRRSLERQRSPVESPSQRKRDLGRDSPLRNASPRAAIRRRSKSLERKSSDSWDRDNTHRKTNTSPSPHRSPVSEDDGKMSPNGNKRSSGLAHSPSPSPRQKSRDYKRHHNSSGRSVDGKDASYLKDDDKRRSKILRDTSMASDQHKDSHGKDGVDELSTERLGVRDPVEAQARTGRMDLDKKAEVLQGGKRSGKTDDLKKPGHEELQNIGDRLSSRRVQESPVGEGYIALEKNQSRIDDIKANDQHLDSLPKLSRKVEQKYESSSESSGSKEGDKKRSKARDKRKKKRLERHRSESEDESNYDSYEEDRKEAKKRRKEEKRSRKEEKRRRREERRRKKEERRAGKLKLKSVDAVSLPSDAEKNHDGHSAEDQHVKRRHSRRSNLEDTETEQKKLEIELREKALENLRAKKSIGH